MFEQMRNLANNIFGGQQEGPPQNPPGFDDDLVAFVEKEFKKRQDDRRVFELQWRLNLAFYEGNQRLDINTASMTLEEMPIMFDFQETECFNHIAPNIETRISKLKNMRTITRCKAGGSLDQADLHAAKIGTHLLKNNYSGQNLREKHAEELSWMEICGTVFRKHIWNPNLGQVIGVANPDIAGEDEQSPPQPGTEQPQGQEVREGEQETIIVPPQEIYPDSSYRDDISSCKSIIHAKAFNVDEIAEIWGVQVRPEKAEAEKLVRSTNGMGGLGYGQGGFMVHNVKLENHAIVMEYMELPSSKHPDGRLIIVAGGKLLHKGPLPYRVGDDGVPGFPFSMLICLKRPGISWGKTVLERLIPVQRRYNALRNRKAEYLSRVSIGQYDIEEGSVDLDAFEVDAAAPGSITEYARGSNPPRERQSPSLPASFEREEETLLNEFAILSGVSEISRQGSVPSGVKSGVAIGLLQEQDDTRLSNTADNIERFEIQSGKIQLRLFKQYVTAPRTLYAVGKNNVAEVIDWIGSDLTSDNVVLDNMSAAVESPIQRRQMVFDLLESGLLNDPETGRLDKDMRSRVFELIEFGEWESADDPEQLHIAKAERENKMMEQGQLPQARNFDNHVIHLNRLTNYRLTTEYEELVTQYPQVDMIFEQHAQMHVAFLAQAQANMMAQQQQQMGAPPPQGAA